jgi:multidrug efflux pump subunit AcrB
VTTSVAESVAATGRPAETPRILGWHGPCFVLVARGTGIKQEVFPEVELEQIMVLVPYPGASPAEVEQALVLAVEEAVQGVDGVKDVRSVASEGSAMVTIQLLLGTDKRQALSDVKSVVGRISSFPADAERPNIKLLSTRRQVISLVLYGDVEETTLRTVASRVGRAARRLGADGRRRGPAPHRREARRRARVC